MKIVTKKGYEIPECKIVALSKEDVITASVYDMDNVLSDPWSTDNTVPQDGFNG